MIVVTGGEGFIGKNLIKELERQGNMGVVCLDTRNESLSSIYEWLMAHAEEIDVIFHLGAITDTMEMDRRKFDTYNVESTIFIWNLCTEYQIPLIYASSAATYGDGEQGFDDEKDILNLEPLNPYGWSKQQFDVWVEGTFKQPPFWYGLKFFNVYGYGEAHKGKMASTIFHFTNQAVAEDKVKLFKSHRNDYQDGEQKRDFVYIDDIVDVCIFMWKEKPLSGIYNVGTGKARSFNDVAKAVFLGLAKPPKIQYIDTPIKIRDKYQYFTEAKINKLRNAGYKKPFHELEEGVLEYVNKLIYENS
jgi:ADP-L-glycero-D-manno-heptose 6-epimerase